MNNYIDKEKLKNKIHTLKNFALSDNRIKTFKEANKYMTIQEQKIRIQEDLLILNIIDRMIDKGIFDLDVN